MDLICLILLIIDLAKPSIPLSIAMLIFGTFELISLCCQGVEFDIAYVISIIGLIIGTYKICVL